MSFTSLIFAVLFSRALAVFDIDSNRRVVGICYSVWHSLGYSGTPPPDITEIQHGSGAFANQGDWHFWGRPDGGYYGGGDRGVLARHFIQLSEAQIDFIAIDATNLGGYEDYPPGLFTEPSDALLDEMTLQRAAGNPTPSVVFWVRTHIDISDPTAAGRFVRDRYYGNLTYSDLWVTLDGRPLLLTTDTLPDELARDFTLRKMWGLQTQLAEGEWSFLQSAPQNVAMKDGVPEQVSVCTAKQATYMSDILTATPRKDGITYQLQWQRAFDVSPKVVMLTWWNEWMAQRQPDDQFGNPRFVDNFNRDYSRDIEPQDPTQPGSHSEDYYTWTKAYISAYKSNQPLPMDLTSYAPDGLGCQRQRHKYRR